MRLIDKQPKAKLTILRLYNATFFYNFEPID